jgi:hypothetical protein
MSALTDEWRAHWQERVALRGQSVILRRLPATDATVNAVVRGYRPEELVGGIQQGTREVVVLAEDLIAAGWPVPPKAGDKVIAHGRTLNVGVADIDTGNLQGVDVFYKLSVT